MHGDSFNLMIFLIRHRSIATAIINEHFYGCGLLGGCVEGKREDELVEVVLFCGQLKLVECQANSIMIDCC
jgi:hypothetical protein